MRALRLLGERQAIVEERPVPEPGPGQVLLKMRAAAVCGSDLHRYREPQPPDSFTRRWVPGHEPCGEVAALGPGVAGWSVGDRVVVYHRVTCMECHYCQTGRRNICLRPRGGYGRGMDGADEEWMVANVPDLLPLPDDFSFVDGALLACQAGTVYAALAAIGLSGRDTLLVSGLGPVGLLGVLFGQAMGARVIGVDPSAPRRALAVGLAADAVLDPAARPLAAAVGELCPGGADRLLETSGAAAAHAAIPALLRTEGEAALVGLGTPGPSLNLAQLISKQIRVFGSNLFANTQYPEIVEFVRRKRVPLARVVTHELGIEDGPAAFQLADSATSGKVVLRLD